MRTRSLFLPVLPLLLVLSFACSPPADPASQKQCDECGVCDADPSNDCTADCAGVFGGTATVDECGECVGGDTGQTACEQDCHGDWGGTAAIDECGECAGGDTGKTACVQDCHGDWGGTAAIDTRDVCAGGQTGLQPCTEVCAGVFHNEGAPLPDEDEDGVHDDCDDCQGVDDAVVPDVGCRVCNPYMMSLATQFFEHSSLFSFPSSTASVFGRVAQVSRSGLT